ncbi:MAG: LysR family transcriptional regulator [Deltaproteobacteria bacterium]|nr:LysR family transcriptional regulator [Deltaproteobacteria bacterium]
MKRARKKTHYTITEAAKKLGVTRAAVHRAIKKKRLEAERGYVEVVRTFTTRTKMKAWKIPVKSLAQYRVSLLHQELGKKTD